MNYSALISPLIESTKTLYGMCQDHEDRVEKLSRDLAAEKAKNALFLQENAEIKAYLCGKDPSATFCR